ncbi:SRPBCC family protein [Polyangium spumosum]|uniref:Polyketide cyclase n=1 Tax=Polyangium spumosum TaxID=889282 RepID=A0A6N7PVR5_9BACT|nr:SRPBCC family protein [Polyangium spumosum]MRG95617.1 polyketide cyclase [Polyangium spumosum]
MIDIVKEINAVHRMTRPANLPGGEGHTVRLKRSYDAAIEDVWDAITNPERVRRWFLPLEGDLRLGGFYQLKGNAGGKILRCEPPRLLEVTWTMGPNKDDESSKVHVQLSAGEKEETVLELDHTAIVPPGMWDEYGPGAVGLGWDLALLGLGLGLGGTYLEDHEKDAFGQTPEGGQFMAGCSEAWRVAHEASGAPADQARKSAEATLKFYRPNPT